MEQKELDLKQLRLRGFRLTPQRLVILKVLQESSGHLTTNEIYERARQLLPGLTEPTVYRTLAFLCEQGLALEAHIANGLLGYESAERKHHHLVCRACGHMHDIDHQAVLKLYQDFEKSTGYQIDTIHLTFFGLCPGCQQDKN